MHDAKLVNGFLRFEGRATRPPLDDIPVRVKLLVDDWLENESRKRSIWHKSILCGGVRPWTETDLLVAASYIKKESCLRCIVDPTWLAAMDFSKLPDPYRFDSLCSHIELNYILTRSRLLVRSLFVQKAAIYRSILSVSAFEISTCGKYLSDFLEVTVPLAPAWQMLIESHRLKIAIEGSEPSSFRLRLDLTSMKLIKE